jgi:heptose-I-phosphate ethanolaminephosphotransferase
MSQTIRSRHQAGIACAVIGTTLLALIVLGHDGRRIAQMAFLATPGVLWLLWPLGQNWMHRIRSIGVWLWTMLFALDGIARAYLQHTYQAAPDGALVLGAMANTNTREGSEYLAMQWRSMLAWAAAIAVATLVATHYAGRGARRGLALAATPTVAKHRRSRWAVGALGLALLATSLAYASKPWRRLHPALFWSNWTQSTLALRAGWAQEENNRDRALKRAQALAPTLTQPGPATVVLVVTDSVNRDNMALYGYGRATTPNLLAHRAQLGGQMVVLKNAWSVDASTLPSLRNMFNFGQAENEDPAHLLAMARAAGYKTWWISNHDDLAIEHKHGRMADVIDMVNRTPGRSGTSLDSELLDCVEEALQDSSERKLIVVHLMGTHPHYSLRFPSGRNPFNDGADAVETRLVNEGRSKWVREFRQEYDAAVLYHDSIVGQLFQMTQDAGKSDPKNLNTAKTAQPYRAWMYLSDHGQEVGHSSNYAGHSPGTPSGYRIPTIIWQSQTTKPRPAGIEQRPFRADWTAWALVDLLNIHWTGDEHTRSVLDDGYRWQDPVLPAKVESFNQ